MRFPAVCDRPKGVSSEKGVFMRDHCVLDRRVSFALECCMRGGVIAICRLGFELCRCGRSSCAHGRGLTPHWWGKGDVPLRVTNRTETARDSVRSTTLATGSGTQHGRKPIIQVAAPF